MRNVFGVLGAVGKGVARGVVGIVPGVGPSLGAAFAQAQQQMQQNVRGMIGAGFYAPPTDPFTVEEDWIKTGDGRTFREYLYGE